MCVYGIRSKCKLIQIISCMLIEIRLRFATNLVAFDYNVFVCNSSSPFDILFDRFDKWN